MPYFRVDVAGGLILAADTVSDCHTVFYRAFPHAGNLGLSNIRELDYDQEVTDLRRAVERQYNITQQVALDFSRNLATEKDLQEALVELRIARTKAEALVAEIKNADKILDVLAESSVRFP